MSVERRKQSRKAEESQISSVLPLLDKNLLSLLVVEVVPLVRSRLSAKMASRVLLP